MQQIPPEVEKRAARVTADPSTYIACMSIIKARLFTIQKLLNNEILIPYSMLRIETIYLQFRLLIEMLYLSMIATRKQKYANSWPRSEKEYQPSEIRKYLGNNLDEHFPYALPHLNGNEAGKPISEPFTRPVNEAQVYDFFNTCHQYLHEPNPYKKKWVTREAECPRLAQEAALFHQKLWALLANHYRTTELDDGEKVGMICFLGSEKEQVVVQYLLSDGKENKAATR